MEIKYWALFNLLMFSSNKTQR